MSDQEMDLFGWRDGITFEPKFDEDRLNAQALRVWRVIFDGRWRTLAEIAERTGDPEASISARLRDLRKERFGGHRVERRRRESPIRGLFEYRLVKENPAKCGGT